MNLHFVILGKRRDWVYLVVYKLKNVNLSLYIFRFAVIVGFCIKLSINKINEDFSYKLGIEILKILDFCFTSIKLL